VEDKVNSTKPGIFFVRGHPRSGTNWVGTLMKLHPHLHCRGEFHFEALLNGVRDFLTPEWCVGSQSKEIKSMVQRAIAPLVEDSLRTITKEKPGAKLIGDVTPHGLVPLTLPNSSYIYLLRDGRDVLVSWTYHLLRIGLSAVPEWHHEPFRKKIERFNKDSFYFIHNPERLLDDEQWVREVARAWASYNRDYLEIADWLAEEERNIRLILVRYEELHRDLEVQRSRIYQFLDVDPALAAPVSFEDCTAAGFDREDPTQFCRKGIVGDWRNYFSAKTSRWFDDEAGDILRQFDYEI
jgi:hypothetical protein